MTPEGIVVAAVEQYFSQPKFRKFSTKKEDRIRFGSRLGFADVVLINNKDRRAAIVECKQSGIEGYGPAQLKSYLCATDTPFGIFANSTEPDDWEFYENLGRNQFEENLRTGSLKVKIMLSLACQIFSEESPNLNGTNRAKSSLMESLVVHQD